MLRAVATGVTQSDLDLYLKSYLPSSYIFVGNASNTATGVALSGDATLSNTGTISLISSGVTAGSYGSSSQNVTFAVDAKGRITSASNTSIQIAESQVTSLVSDLAARLITTNNLSDLTDSSTARDNLGLGSIAIQPADGVNITGSITAEVLLIKSSSFFWFEDTDASNLLQLSYGSNLSVNKTLTFYVTDNYSLTIAGNTTISNTNSGDITLSGQNYLSLSGQALTANQINLSSNVTGTLPLTNGGSNASLTASNGGIVYSTASAMAILSGVASANRVLLSGNSAAPSWSSATYPNSTTVNQLLYSSAANTITGLTSANDGTLITSSTGVPSISSTLPTAVQSNITRLGTIGQRITISGVTTDALVISHSSGVSVSATMTNAANPCIYRLNNGNANWWDIQNNTDNSFSLDYNDNTRFVISSTGNITTGSWQATKIGLAYGGTNADLSATGGTSQVLKQISAGDAITVGQLAASDLSNGTTGSGSIVLAANPTLTGFVTISSGAANGLSISLTGANYGLQVNNTSANNTIFRLKNNSNNYWDTQCNTDNTYTIDYNDTTKLTLSVTGMMTLNPSSGGNVINCNPNSDSIGNIICYIGNTGGTGSAGHSCGYKTGAYNGGEIGFIANGDDIAFNGISANSGGIYSSDKDFYFTSNGGSGSTYTSRIKIANSDGTFTAQTGDIAIDTLGKTLKIKRGTNACSGTGAVMTAGSVTVSTTAVATGDIVISTRTTASGTLGHITYSISNGVSFTLTSSSGLDTSTFSWVIIKAA